MARSFDPVVPAALAEQDGSSYPRLVALVQRLLEPDGCPWDRDQDFASLRRYVQEEAAEVVDALDRGDRDALRLELGDLLYQVVFLGEIARQQGDFGPDDVVAAIVGKLVHRHPHVFGDDAASDAREVRRKWERIKAEERRQSGDGAPLLGSVPPALSALARAQRIGEKVAAVGFDWPDVAGARTKLDEELGELDAAIAAMQASAAGGADGDAARHRDRAEAELGDVLFALTNLARHLGLECDAALRRTTRKFTDRFGHVERRVHETRGGWPVEGPAIELAELDRYWEEAKAAERRADATPTRAAPARAGSDTPRTG